MSQTDPLVGQRLGEYEILAPLGEGGMGVVYRGVQPLIKKRVAIKVLKAAFAQDESQVRRLRDEAEAVNSIHHRNIIDIFSLGQLPDGRPYVVMEYLEGQPLDAYLRGVGRLGLGEAVALLISVCGPLAAAHRANVIHRDLKPSNIFLCQGVEGERYLKLLDFGLAKKAASLDGRTEQTSQASIIGTPNYMAPEQARGLAVSAHTDIYALGVMAYELLAGELPYTAPTPMDLLVHHVSSPVPKLRARLPEAPPELEALVARMMAKRAEDRPRNVEEIRAALLDLSKTLGPAATFESLNPVSGEYKARLPPLATPSALPAFDAGAFDATHISSKRKAPGRRSSALGIGLGVVVVAALGVAVVLTSPDDAPAQPPVVTPPPVPPPPVVVPAPPPPPVAVEPAPTPAPTPTPEPPKPVVRPPRLKGPPTADALRSRIDRFEAALKKATPAGEDPDPTALTLLRKYRVEATMVDSEEDRRSLAGSLDGFERSFLRR